MKRWILIAAASTIAWNTHSAPGADKAATRSVDEMTALKGDDFRAAINEVSWQCKTLPLLTTDDLLKLAERCATECAQWPKDDYNSENIFQDLVERCIKQAPLSEIDRVAHFVGTLPFPTYQRATTFGSILNLYSLDTMERPPLEGGTPFVSLAIRFLQREIAAIRAEHREPLQIELDSASLPESKTPVPPGLLEGARRFVAAAKAADLVAQRSDGKWRGYSTDPSGFHTLRQRILLGENSGILEQLALYRRDIMCDDAEPETSLVWGRWLVLARERRLQEAIGVSFQNSYFPKEDIVTRLRRDFLDACGVDAAQLCAGMVLATGGSRMYTGRTRTCFPKSDLKALASGSSREAEMMLQLADIAWAQPHVRVDRFSDNDYTLAFFAPALGIVIARSGTELTPLKREYSAYFDAELDELRKAGGLPPLPQPLRARAADLLLTYLDPALPLSAIKCALDQVAGLRMSEARGSVRKLLDHWSADIRKNAVITLTILGEDAKEPNIPKTVVFQLMRNRKPLAHCKPYADLVNPDKPFEFTNIDTFSADGTKMGMLGEGTDDKAMIAVLRDVLVDPVNRKRFTHLVFSHGTQSMEGDRDTPAPLFCVKIPVPKDLNAVTRVVVDTHPVTFRLLLNRPPEFYRDKRLALTLKRLNRPSWRRGRDEDIPYRLPITENLVLPDVQAGFYSVTIHSPGAAEWRLNHLEVREGMKPVKVRPADATDVRFKVVLPDQKMLYPRCRFYRDGKSFWPTFIYGNGQPEPNEQVVAGLVPGSYKVRVLSSAEVEADLQHDPDEVVSRKPGYEGAELSFEIPADRPPEMDLGEIRLKAAK